jgi:hypothetical protein
VVNEVSAGNAAALAQVVIGAGELPAIS